MCPYSSTSWLLAARLKHVQGLLATNTPPDTGCMPNELCELPACSTGQCINFGTEQPPPGPAACPRRMNFRGRVDAGSHESSQKGMKLKQWATVLPKQTSMRRAGMIWGLFDHCVAQLAQPACSGQHLAPRPAIACILQHISMPPFPILST